MGELLVRGRAEGRLAPSHAVLDVTVQARDPSSQEAALARAASACALVDDAIGRARGGADPLIRSAETSSITTTEHWDYRAGERHRLGWVAQRGNRLECAPDAEGLTALVRDLTHNDVHVSGLVWRVAADDPGWGELRTAAVVDARRRAEAYATGVGTRAGAVRWIAEPGLRHARAAEGPGAPMEVTRGLAAATAEQPEHLPVRITVEPVAADVTVEVAFDLADVA